MRSRVQAEMFNTRSSQMVQDVSPHLEEPRGSAMTEPPREAARWQGEPALPLQAPPSYAPIVGRIRSPGSITPSDRPVSALAVPRRPQAALYAQRSLVALAASSDTKFVKDSR